MSGVAKIEKDYEQKTNMPFLGSLSRPLIDSISHTQLIEKTQNPAHKLLFSICWELGETFSTLLRLRTTDVYLSPIEGIPDTDIWLPCHGAPFRMREIPATAGVEAALRAYQPPCKHWLFPSSTRPGEHLSHRAAARALERCAKKSGLEYGLSPRELQQSAIAYHRREGKTLEELAKLTGLQPNSVARHLAKLEAPQPVLSRI